MKRIIMALTVVAVLLTWSNLAAAAGLTHEQIDELVECIGQNPATMSANTSTLNVDIDGLQKDFNADINSILAQAQFENDEQREVMEKLFLIKDYQIFAAEEGKIFMNAFGNSVVIIGVTGNEDDRFKLLACAFATPENQDDMTLSSLVLASFVKVILPDADPEQFLNELFSAQSGDLIRDGIHFTVEQNSNLNILTAVVAK